ncbi:hypothetical protein [Thalassomonas actiniarum]|uniref:Beta/gamma crystallin 'Greek key' domain-containing protein n=1 Tax=Thalassomonas actiniarum TaxID=485447 RepID=A0AAE9YNP4_9GAMM|nr:hypothetical protein [Thalassomonas actiniarum]WDD96716.1 hypothetical protein SG35_015160 [Thalassomonas actiniarum]
MKISIISTLATLALGASISMTALPVQATAATTAAERWIVACFNQKGGIIFIQDYDNYNDATQAANYCTSIRGSWHITHL